MVAGILCNIGYNLLEKEEASEWMIFLFRDISHFAFLQLTVFFITYIIDLVRINDNKKKEIVLVSEAICLLFAILDCISPLTHYGLYVSNGRWIDDAFVKPYGAGYIINCIFLGAIIIKYRKRIIKKIVSL